MYAKVQGLVGYRVIVRIGDTSILPQNWGVGE
jgi:hypothetical protein